MHAKDTLNELADRVLRELQPEGRAKAIADTLREIGKIGGSQPLTLADCAAGFNSLSKSKEADEPENVTGRRITCGELAKLAGSTVEGNPVHLAEVFRRIASWFRGWSEDPREIAMVVTADREVAEIKAIFGGSSWRPPSDRYR